MKVAVVGTGYVGLVVGTCFAETGHNVISVDSDRAKIEGLKAGKLPIYEPGLEDLVVSNQKEGRLVFSTALPEAVAQSEIVFLTVGTPSREGGSVDLTYVLGVAKEVALAMNEPVGVIGAILPDEAPLLGLISVMAPAIAMGNTCILVPGQHPLAATDFYQVLDTSDVPPGVVNIVTGPAPDLAKSLAGHMDVDAVWSFSSQNLSALIEREAAANLKRTWVNHGKARNWLGPEGEGRTFLAQSTEVKTVWVPYGE